MSRSFLFVPADSERKLEKAAASAADALIVDLEDSVAAARRDAARVIAAEFVKDREACWVRINPLDTDDAGSDLKAVMAAAPAGIVLPKPRGAEDVAALAAMLDALEEEHGIEQGSTGILPVATERPAALFTLHHYAEATPRLSALTWGAEDLSTAVGALTNRDDDGNWLPPYELARSLCLMGAAAAGVPAIDTVYTDFGNDEGLQNFVDRARRDGFTGMLAIHPRQLDVINAAFTPTEAELERARRIVEFFEANEDAGVFALDGEMIDMPHLKQARRILQLADRIESS